MWVDMWFLESWLVTFLYEGAIFLKTMLRSLGNEDSRIYKDWCIFKSSPPIPQWTRDSLFTSCLDHNHRRTTVNKTLLNKWSACRRGLYLITHSTHNRQTSMTPAGFKPTISAGERPHTYTLDREAPVTLVPIYETKKTSHATGS
jgi:hypothetical protein